MKRLVQGNEATFLGAVKAGADFFAGYPITPSNEVMAGAAKYASEHEDFTFMQMEDEIASIAAIIGASMSGAKSFTATSGPGLSLMLENIGLAYMTSTPIVIVDVQRVGPSTGMPTYPAQGDVLQAKHGSHGDYTSIVIAPNSVPECYQYTAEAFNIAEEAEAPVIVLTDGFVGHLEETVDLDKVKTPAPVERQREKLGTGKRHFTGLISDEKGHPKTADPEVYRQWYWARKKQVESVAKEHSFFEYEPNDASDTLLISFGITSRVIEPLKEKYGYFRPIRLFPILEKEIKEAAQNYEKIVVVEANDGQLAGEVEHVLERPVERIPLLGGEIKLSLVEEMLK
ncbi:2-oxoacid:acceptor oxidoreductase subunit alpha [Patescibacteria group bacterium]